MQISVRSNRCRLFIILLSLAIFKTADGQEPTTPKVDEPAMAKGDEPLTFALPMFSELPIPNERFQILNAGELKEQPLSALPVPPVNPLSPSALSLNHDMEESPRSGSPGSEEFRGVVGALRQLEEETVSQSSACDAQPMPPQPSQLLAEPVLLPARNETLESAVQEPFEGARSALPTPRYNSGETLTQKELNEAVQIGSTRPQSSDVEDGQSRPMVGSVNPIATSVMEGEIQPVGFNQPAKQKPNTGRNANALDLTLAHQAMDAFDLTNASLPLPGQPVTLLELLQQTRPAYRSDMINQYWQTYASWAHYRNALEYQKWLQQASRPQSQAERALLSAARNEALSQVLLCEIELEQGQQRLQEFVGVPADSLPLPKDRPLIKGYDMHYDWFFKRQLVPSKLIGINQRLPKQLKLIVQQAETAKVAKSAMNQTRSAFTSGQLGVASVLESGRLWRTSRDQLIGTVTRYNQSIADYATAVHPNFKSPDQIVAMLIIKPLADSRVDLADAILNNTPPVARTADLSVTRPIGSSPVRTNPGRSQTFNPSSGIGGVPLDSTPSGLPSSSSIKTRGLLAPPRSAFSSSGNSPSGGVQVTPSANPSSGGSVLETGLPSMQPKGIPQPPPTSSTQPTTNNGFGSPNTFPASNPKPVGQPSNNGFGVPPVNPSTVAPPTTDNNTFGG